MLTGGAKFEAGRSILDVDLPDTADDLANAQLLTFGLDLDEDVGVTDETYFLRVGSEGFALEIEDGSLAVGIISAPEPTTPATDTRRWIAVQAAGLSGSLGLGELFTAVASAIDVLVNGASGVLDLDGDLNTKDDQTSAEPRSTGRRRSTATRTATSWPAPTTSSCRATRSTARVAGSRSRATSRRSTSSVS